MVGKVVQLSERNLHSETELKEAELGEEEGQVAQLYQLTFQ